jgi:glycosyltransferase involved in cell wall biosynthesis
MKVTGVVLTKNEEKNIERCLESLSWCDEIIVIDDYSTDKTKELAEKRGAVAIKRRLGNNFAAQRNFALKKAKNDWVLFVDADEIVSPSLSQEIVRRLKTTTCNGFLIPRQEVFIGRKLNCADKPSWDWSFGHNKLLRLGKKSKGIWKGKVHEVWEIDGEIGVLKTKLIHYSYPSISAGLKKINKYSSLRAKELHDQKKNTNLAKILIYPVGKFLKDFFWQGGYKDKTAGFIYCLLFAFLAFLTQAKLWQISNS